MRELVRAIPAESWPSYVRRLPVFLQFQTPDELSWFLVTHPAAARIVATRFARPLERDRRPLDDIEFLDWLTDRYSAEEFKELLIECGISDGDVGGNTLRALMLDTILWSRRHGKRAELETVARQKRS